MSIITIVISICALSVSMLTLGWTIYRDAIQKPKFRVSVAISTIYRQVPPIEERVIIVDALNVGPLPNRVGLVFVRKGWWDRLVTKNSSHAFVYPDYQHYGATAPAKKIEVGDTANFIFPYNQDCFLRRNWEQVGVQDGFGKTHWASKKSFRVARNQYLRDFGMGNSHE